MGTAKDTTKIEWTAIRAVDGSAVPGWTFNAWEGCAKISAGCRECYASTQHSFYYSALTQPGQPGTCWGLSAPRMARTEAYWRQPRRWNQLAGAAQAAGTEVNRRRVFCASMSDVFEVQTPLSKAFAGGAPGLVPTGKGTMRQVHFVDIDQVRVRLLRLIHDTPALDWLLLTKRPENIMPALQAALATLPAEVATHPEPAERGWYEWLRQWAAGEQAPVNVWLGTSVENQAAADERIPRLLAASARVRFLSLEPLLGPVELPLLYCRYCLARTQTILVNNDKDFGCPKCRCCKSFGRYSVFNPSYAPGIDWLIVGGESGHHARPLETEWVTRILEQARDADVPVLVKQMGSVWARAHGSSDKAATALADLPPALRQRKSPASVQPSADELAGS